MYVACRLSPVFCLLSPVTCHLSSVNNNFRKNYRIRLRTHLVIQTAFLFSDILKNESTHLPVDYEVLRKNSEMGVFTCPYRNCSKTFKWKINLYGHWLCECNMYPRFQCLYCPHRCKVKKAMKNHLQKKHKR